MKRQYLLLCFVFLSGFLSAATITVTTTADEDDGNLNEPISLREAIRYSAAGDEIVLMNTTYTLSLVLGTDPESTNIVPDTRDLDVQHNLTITGNGATIDAGDIDRILQVVSGVTVIVNDVTFTNGTAMHFNPMFDDAQGGGIYNAGNLTLNNCIISNCLTDNSTTDFGDGGGIYNAGTLNMTNCTVSGNQSGTSNFGNDGGGIYSESGVLTMNICTVSGNLASPSPADLGEGGGVFINGGTFNITNCTVSGNTSTRLGGGITLNGGTSTINFCTITNNTTSNGGGGLHVAPAAQSSVSNTIIAGNTNIGDNEFSDLQNSFISAGYNLVGIKPDGYMLDATDQFGTEASPLDPNLGPLQNNGGSTETHALQNPSPAYNAADPGAAVSEDQRGTARPQLGRADIGAFESTAVLPVELLSFKGQPQKNGILLVWATASETNNAGFEVQRLTNDKWQKLDFIKGQGTTLEEQNYSFVDEQPLNGLNYYRLQQLDTDGAFEYSNIISIAFNSKGKLQLSPNPVQEELQWSVSNQQVAVKEIVIYDQLGRLVQQLTTNESTINLSDLPKGSYHFQVATVDGAVWTEQFVKN